MGDRQKELADVDEQIPALRADYENATVAFTTLVAGRSKREDRLAAFNAWHRAGLTLFNAHDRIIALGSLLKADLNPTWYTDRAETAANVLEVVCQHYETVSQWVDDLKLAAHSLRPSPTAFANMQRLVEETHPEIARKLRQDHVKLNLPTHGFDTPASEKPVATQSIEWRFFWVGCGFAVFSILIAAWGFSLGTLTPDQRFILRWIFPIASAFASGSFTGAFVAGSKKFLWSLAVAATGGFAVWLLTNLFLLSEG